MNVPSQVIEAIARLHRPVLIGHVRPDADCLGSMLAVGVALRNAGLAPRASLPDSSVSRRLSFLPAWSEIPAATEADFAAADGFIVVDTAKLSRCSVLKSLGENWPRERAIINIDHHASNTVFGRVNWVVPHASSTAELVYHLCLGMNWPITTRIASLLYAGLHSDTVGFSLSTTTATSLAAAAKLVEAGAEVAAIGNRLWRSHSRNEFDLLRLVYDNVRITPDGAIAYSTVSHEEMQRLGCSAADIDEQVNVPRSIEGIRMAILFSEGRPGKTRINLRGEGVDVLPLALDLGGGGHAESAGAVIEAPLAEAVPQVLTRAQALLTLIGR